MIPRHDPINAITMGAHGRHREGVLWHQDTQCDLLFITLRKSEALFSPSTRTRDLALDPSLFHCWESRWRLERAIPAMWMPGRCLA
ncbi:hypothetical protein KBY97_01040 [Synechococcus sp. ATX 2A4]|nr:hypothetical protein [Synechococcus sp. ATX 2A4]MCP9883713.1 hypothetical protein [Synechococcus sp. ATX 2A4]